MRNRCEAWRAGLGIFERYAYAPDKQSTTDWHSHEEWQFCWSPDFPGRYDLAHDSIPVPVGSVSVVRPGDRHRSADPYDREFWSHYWVVYLSDEAVRSLLETDREVKPQRYVVLDAQIQALFWRLHLLSQRSTEALAFESLSFEFTRKAFAGFGTRLEPPKEHDARRSMSVIRDYLAADPTRNVSLAELGALVAMHPNHVVRAFRKEFGQPPHAFQNSIRLNLARELLMGGMKPSQVAVEAGFADQAHLTRRFRNAFGVTPGGYRPHATWLRTFNPPRAQTR